MIELYSVTNGFKTNIRWFDDEEAAKDAYREIVANGGCIRVAVNGIPLRIFQADEWSRLGQSRQKKWRASNAKYHCKREQN